MLQSNNNGKQFHHPSLSRPGEHCKLSYVSTTGDATTIALSCCHRSALSNIRLICAVRVVVASAQFAVVFSLAGSHNESSQCDRCKRVLKIGTGAWIFKCMIAADSAAQILHEFYINPSSTGNSVTSSFSRTAPGLSSQCFASRLLFASHTNGKYHQTPNTTICN